MENVNYRELIEYAEEKAQQFKKDGLKTNQIRNFYAQITRIRTDYELAVSKDKEDQSFDTAYPSLERQLIMLKPSLAYAAGRQRAVKANFYPFMTHAIDEVLRKDDKIAALQEFFDLVQSVVAYHKFYGD